MLNTRKRINPGNSVAVLVCAAISMLATPIAAQTIIADPQHSVSALATKDVCQDFVPAGYRAAAHQPTLFILFVDLSDSASDDDRRHWLDAACRMVFRPVNFGDAVIAYGMHDHTAESAPFFEASVRMLGATMSDTVGPRQDLARARFGGSAAVLAALREPVRARNSRIIESMRRVKPEPGRKTEIVYLSDMLEATRDLNLESTRLTPANMVPLAQSAVNRYGLTRGALDRAIVYCVLDSPAIGAPPRLNNRESLEQFWGLIFTSLGGKLMAFDSRAQ